MTKIQQGVSNRIPTDFSNAVEDLLCLEQLAFFCKNSAEPICCVGICIVLLQDSSVEISSILQVLVVLACCVEIVEINVPHT